MSISHQQALSFEPAETPPGPVGGRDLGREGGRDTRLGREDTRLGRDYGRDEARGGGRDEARGGGRGGSWVQLAPEPSRPVPLLSPTQF